MSDSPRFSVIIPVYNKWELTADCLRSLREHTPEYDFEVIVVDNASSDATATELQALGRELFGRSFLRLRFEENRNFSPACNAGAKSSSAPVLFFLNNDTLLTPGWAPPLLTALESEPRLGGVGPLLLYPDETVQHLGVAFSGAHVGHLYQGFPADHAAVKKRREFQVITGAALMLTREMFWEYEGFYEEYRNGFEDVDFCLRAHAAGKKFACIPGSRVYHLESQSQGRHSSEQSNSQLLKRRCADLERTDLHLYGWDDGFEAFVDDFFTIRLKLRTEQEEALLRAVEGKGMEAYCDCINREPLWTLGKERCAEILEKAGRFEEALAFRAALLAQLGSEQACKKLLRCAVQARDTAAYKRVESRLRGLLRYKQDRKECEFLAQRMLRKAERFGDARLADMYREKLAAMFPA